MQIIYQNQALGISFLKKADIKVIRGNPRSKIVKKGQISIFFKSRQIIPQNDALEPNFSKKLVSWSFEVIPSQLRSKITKKHGKNSKFAFENIFFRFKNFDFNRRFKNYIEDNKLLSYFEWRKKCCRISEYSHKIDSPAYGLHEDQMPACELIRQDYLTPSLDFYEGRRYFFNAINCATSHQSLKSRYRHSSVFYKADW